MHCSFFLCETPRKALEENGSVLSVDLRQMTPLLLVVIFNQDVLAKVEKGLERKGGDKRCLVALFFRTLDQEYFSFVDGSGECCIIEKHLTEVVHVVYVLGTRAPQVTHVTKYLKFNNNLAIQMYPQHFEMIAWGARTGEYMLLFI